MFHVVSRLMLAGLLAMGMGGRLHGQQGEGPAAASSASDTASADATKADPTKADPNKADADKADADWRPLPAAADGAWQACQFGGDGEVVIENGLIQLGFGDPLTGVRCTAKLPRENYELRLESRRTSNFDFFCGLTFPVGEGQCSLILGGWAGSILGLSSIDGEDASSNPTTQFRTFDNDRWYQIRVRVDKQRIQAWVDDKKWVDQERAGHTFDIRAELEPCLPLGIAAYQCDAEARKLFWRPLKDSQAAEAARPGADASAAPSPAQP